MRRTQLLPTRELRESSSTECAEWRDRDVESTIDELRTAHSERQLPEISTYGSFLQSLIQYRHRM